MAINGMSSSQVVYLLEKMNAAASFWEPVWDFPLVTLLRATAVAFWRILMQAAGFFTTAFGGDAGPWLVASLLLLAAAIGLNFVHSRIESRPGRARGGVYFGTFGLIALALALLLIGGAFTSFQGPAQRLLFFLLGIASGLHVIWFGGDLLCHGLKWRRGGDYFKRIAQNRTAYYMVLPTLLLLGTFLYVPAITVFYYSFHEYDMGGTSKWLGLGNYVRLAGDEIFWKSMGNLAILTFLGLFFTLSVPLFVAELVFHLKTERMRYYLRAAFLIPMVVPGVVMFLIWGYFYSDAGLIPLFGHAIGLGDALEGLLSRPQTALYAVVFVGFPFVMGINLLIFYAGLSNIDEAVWEAARMDGAKPLRRFWLIDLPLLARQFKLLLILGIITGVQAFENVLVMTHGGPGWETMLPGLYMYRSAISFSEFGFACAVGVILFLLVLILSLAVNRGVPTSKG